MCFIPVADRVTGELKLSAISETVNRPNAPSAGPPHHRYNRAFFKGDTIVDDANVFGRGIDHLIPHGYIVAAVDSRGGGASFGTQQGFLLHDVHALRQALGASRRSLRAHSYDSHLALAVPRRAREHPTQFPFAD